MYDCFARIEAKENSMTKRFLVSTPQKEAAWQNVYNYSSVLENFPD